MGVFTTGFIAKLKADGTLQGLLSTYDSAAAVFSNWPPPADAEKPFIVLSPNQSMSDDGAKGGIEIQDFDREAVCFTENTGSVAVCESIAERVRALLHLGTVSVTGYTQVDMRASGPTNVNTDHNVIGRAVGIHARYQKD